MKKAFMFKPKMARRVEIRQCYTGATMELRLSAVLEAVLHRLALPSVDDWRTAGQQKDDHP